MERSISQSEEKSLTIPELESRSKSSLFKQEQEQKEVLYFFDKTSERVPKHNLFLNNFYFSPFEVDGFKYNSVEQYYQVTS